MRWKLIGEYGTGDVLEVVEGTYNRASKRKAEMEKEYGHEIVISQSI